ncbi:MAG: hypothetical protein IPN53_07825 [Comamonadaceae bacterium]|nr:hypothetical protein [Comamonadaceae bacterium]
MLYTEDGTWSAGLINRGFWDMLFNAKEGHARYFVFGNIILLTLAQLANTALFGHDLSYLPHFVSFFSMLFYSVLAVAPIYLLRNVLVIEARILLWFLVLLVPLGDSSFEVLGRLSNIGFTFLFLAFCLLVWRRYSLHDDDRKCIVAADAMLFICANTNPLCYPLIAIAYSATALGHWKSRGKPDVKVWFREYLTKFSIKSALTLLSLLLAFFLWMLLREKGVDQALDGTIESKNLIEALISRPILYPVIFPFYQLLDNKFSIFLVIFLLILILHISKKTVKEQFALISAVLILIVGSVVTVVSRPALTSILDAYRTTFPDRYYYGLSLFVFVAIACSLSIGFCFKKNNYQRNVANASAGIFISLYLSNSFYLFEFSKTHWYDPPIATFQDDVKRAYRKGAEPNAGKIMYRVDLHPKPLAAHFPESYVAATALGFRFLPANLVSHQVMIPSVFSDNAKRYEGKIIRQTPAGRGRGDGWFYVSEGMRFWIPDGQWLKSRNLSPSEVITISSLEFESIPDSGRSVK